MDKFGIFKLLNSLFPLSAQNSNGETAQSAPNGAGDFLKNIASALTNNSAGTDKFSTQTPTENKPAKPDIFSTNNDSKSQTNIHPPLQAGMLNVMRSHDEFVKRVKGR